MHYAISKASSLSSLSGSWIMCTAAAATLRVQWPNQRSCTSSVSLARLKRSSLWPSAIKHQLINYPDRKKDMIGKDDIISSLLAFFAVSSSGPLAFPKHASNCLVSSALFISGGCKWTYSQPAKYTSPEQILASWAKSDESVKSSPRNLTVFRFLGFKIHLVLRWFLAVTAAAAVTPWRFPSPWHRFL